MRDRSGSAQSRKGAVTRRTFALTAAFGLAACLPAGAQSVSPDYLAIEWKVVSIDGLPFAPHATLDLATAGKIAGRGPCNRFFGSYEGTLPEFRPGAIASTKMACPDMAAEAALFAALSAMTRAEVTGPVSLSLSGAGGRRIELVRPQN